MSRRRVTFPHPNEECVVGPSRLSYHCPSLEAVDGHLKRLRKKIRTSGSEVAVLTHLADADALLDRRNELAAQAC